MRTLLLLLFSFLISLSSYSTHLMGGQITATYLNSDSSGSHYILEFTAYRDTVGIAMQNTALFDVSILDTSGSWNLLYTHTIDYDTNSGNLMPSVSTYGVEVYTFLDTIILPSNGYYSISWDDCCRNGAIVNMSNPLQESMRLTTYLEVDTSSVNSSPTYLTPPIAYLPDDTLWQYNPLPFDPDGDSLTWSMVTPLDDFGNVSGYTFLSDTLYSDTNGIFSLDSVTGELSWDPAMIGNFATSFIIEEWRNGIKIGEMRRDMQFIVISDTTNAMPQISNMQTVPTNTGGYPYVKIYPGQNYQLHLLANDADVNDVLSMTTYGEAFSLNLSPAGFTYNTTGNGNEIQGIFSWTPDVTHVRKAPYITVFRTSDNTFYYDETIQFEVALSTNLDNVNNFSLGSVYPNPTKNVIYIPLNISKDQEIVLDIYNILGVKASSSTKLSLSSGNHLLIKNFNLKEGCYFVTIKNSNGKIISNQKIIVRH